MILSTYNVFLDIFSLCGEESIMTMQESRPNIGFLTCHLDNDYAMEVCKGVQYAVKEADCNLIIFPGMYLNASYNDPVNAKYDYQYNSIFYYASQKSLDALIISIGSIGKFLSVEDKKSFIDNFDIPVLTIEIEVPGYPFLYTEGQTGMKQIIEHLINDHHKTKIGFVNGRLENADALERFNVYKRVLKENGIEYDESRVAYGDFSEYTEDIVGTLLDTNPDLEAIVFANDTMAIGGYKAIKKRGLVIGKDILVTGYDNAPISLNLSPQLTTVDNNIMDLGYNAVYQALELLKTGESSVSLLHSKMVRRLSCGCNPADDEEINDISANLSTLGESGVLEKFKNIFMSQYKDSFYSKQLFDILDPYFTMFIHIIFSSDTPNPEEINISTENVLSNEIIVYYFSHTKITYLLNSLSHFLGNLNIPAEKKYTLSNIFNIVLANVASIISNEYSKALRMSKENIWSSVYLVRDTLLTATDDKRCFQFIMNKLHQSSGFQSAYIYLYDETPIQLASGLWQIPKYVLLQTYCKDGKIRVLDGDNRMLPSYMIFSNKNTPNERRHTMILTPVFTNEVQHGIFLCEADLSNFSNVYSTSLQLGTALKFISLMKQELAIQNRLESTMNEIREKNDLLNSLSVTDELTGLYNRRGFFETSQQIIANTSNAGKHSLIAYIDMDNLKQVNDKFGHKDGDYALVSISNTLKKSFPKGSILARIGGDEYAAFAPDLSDTSIDEIKTSLNYYSDRENEGNNKPYYIEFSYGFKQFICSDSLNIEVDMAEADEMLYVDKKNKRKSILKSIK